VSASEVPGPAPEQPSRRATPPAVVGGRPDPAGVPVTGTSPWNLPNAITVARLLLVPVFVVALVQVGESSPSGGWAWFAAGVFAVASFTDFIDGDLARRRGQVTTFGKVADPIADKALTGAALIGLSWLGELSWWVTAVVLVREIGVTLLRFWVIEHGVIPASRGGKLKTVLLIVAILLYLVPLPSAFHAVAAVVMAAAVVVTVVTGLDYVLRAVRLRRESLAARGAA
jgi:CDP-diacylglycerol---glycerol-3-phosphate 3-phosphatidyltransferase